MTPFLQFRLWMREGPAAERLLTAVVGAVLVALLAWAAVPSGSGGSFGQGRSSVAAGAAAGGGTGGSAQAPVAGAAPSGQQGAVASVGTPAAATATSTDQGVSGTQITIGIVAVDLGPANETIQLPSVADLQKAYNAVFDYYNAAGGVQCRKLVPKYYSDNVLDVSSEQAACLQMQQDRVFAVFNNLFTPQEQTCVAKAHIPDVWYTPPHTPDVTQYSPYILSWQPDYDRLIRDYVHGAQVMSFFADMTKVGVLEESCFPDENTDVMANLAQIGIPPAQITTYNYGCPSAQTTPDQDQQAVLQFKTQNVSHVVNVAYSATLGFSQAADQQGYRPKFSMMEDAAASVVEQSQNPPGKSFDNALLIAAIGTGAENTPGYQWNQATNDCAKILAKAGLPAPGSSQTAKFFGIACADTKLFVEAASRAPSLVRNQLSGGLAQAGSVDLSYPAGPVNVSDTRIPTGGQFWRAGRFSGGKWVLVDPRGAWRPGF